MEPELFRIYIQKLIKNHHSKSLCFTLLLAGEFLKDKVVAAFTIPIPGDWHVVDL